MADDELRGKTCQSILEDDRVCGKPAVVKEFGCYFCAEHGSVAPPNQDSLKTKESGPPKTGLVRPETPKTKAYTGDTEPDAPKKKAPATTKLPPPPVKDKPLPPAEAPVTEKEVEPVKEKPASPSAVTEKKEIPAAPTVKEPPKPSKPTPATNNDEKPKPAGKDAPAQPQIPKSPPASKAPPSQPVVTAGGSLPATLGDGDDGYVTFAKAVNDRVQQNPADISKVKIDPNKATFEALSKIEDDLVNLAAQSYQVWEKVRALQPSKQELELQKFTIKRFYVDLAAKKVRREEVPCKDLEDVMGGIARGFKILEDRPIDDPYDPTATLVMNLGILSGTQFMTGLRTYFHGYSPLKTSLSGRPSAMWSAGSGKFGTKLRYLDVDEVIFEGRCAGPTMLHISRPDPEGPPVFSFEEASFLSGRRVNDKIQTLYRRYPNAHFAVIGPAGEAYKQVRYAAIALSTENQLKSGDSKPRFCGRGGIGGVMGSKNLLAIVADTPDKPMAKAPPEMKPINVEVARGKGSSKLRDKKKNGQGGTWANYEALQPVHSMPEMNFVPTGTDISLPLFRDNVEKEGRFVVKDEACYRCGIACHKNVYNAGREGKPGRFRAKLDFEPLNLLSSNIGIFDVDEACELVALVDEMGMDSISCGVTLSYAMEYNKRHQGNGSTIADDLRYGDFEGARRAVENIGLGRMELLGQGVKRLSEQLGEIDYAVHVKGVELPAYLPQTNPGYPWALAGGHMSMRTYLLYVYEKEKSIDYWVDAILNRGIQILRDDFLGVCKFAGLNDENMCTSVKALTGLEVSVEQMQRIVRRTFLRGYRLERRQGFTDADYVLPPMSHQKYDQIQLEYFNTKEFFGELKDRVLQEIDRMLVEEDLQDATS